MIWNGEIIQKGLKSNHKGPWKGGKSQSGMCDNGSRAWNEIYDFEDGVSGHEPRPTDGL